MSLFLIVVLCFIAAFHILAFYGEVVLWKRPGFAPRFLKKINHNSGLSPEDEAGAMAVLMVNQGFYNLMIAFGAVLALMLGGTAAGMVLAAYVCGFAAVAGAVLFVTTRARAGAILQAVPGIIGMILTLA